MYDRPSTVEPLGQEVRGGTARAFAPSPPGPSNGRSEIAIQLEQQEKLSHALHEALHGLEQKLAPLVVSGPEASSDARDVQGCCSQIGNCIAANSGRIIGAIQRVQRLTAELAV